MLKPWTITCARLIGLTGCLLALLASSSAFAKVQAQITTGQPTKNGAVTVNIRNTNSGLNFSATATILGTDTPEKKAEKISAAINDRLAKLEEESDPAANIVEPTSVNGNKITVTQGGGGGMAITFPQDTTGEGASLTQKPLGGNAEHWFWRFVRWLVASANPIVPPEGTALAIKIVSDDTGSPGNLIAEASVLGDGIKTADALQDEITQQLFAQGLQFTSVYDPNIGLNGIASQWIPMGDFPVIGFGVSYSAGWGDYLGGVGVESITEPSVLPLLILSFAASWFARRRKLH